MRGEVVSALTSLSDRRHQKESWGRYDRQANRYDDLDLNVHILYDDCMVLPEPGDAVGDILREAEVPLFLVLGGVLGPMIERLGDAPHGVYTSDPHWDDVVAAAGAALTVMLRTGDGGAE